ncbi:MAG: RNA polymerase sigma factor [Thioalkalivibrio sp.]|nr:RNA polymerase sigma factor [Thioalkalivibrio sp.]
MNEPGVRQLIRRAHAGESEVLGGLLARCEHRLRLRARGGIRAAVAARCDAADIVQQSLMEAVRSFDTFHGQTEAELLAWLERIVHRNLADAIRANVVAKKRAVTDESRISQHPELASQRTSATQKLVRKEEAARLERAIATLPADQGEAVRLRHLSGHSLQEISRLMGRTPVAVASLIKRGMRQLRELLEQKGRP